MVISRSLASAKVSACVVSGPLHVVSSARFSNMTVELERIFWDAATLGVEPGPQQQYRHVSTMFSWANWHLPKFQEKDEDCTTWWSFEDLAAFFASSSSPFHKWKNLQPRATECSNITGVRESRSSFPPRLFICRTDCRISVLKHCSCEQTGTQWNTWN